MRIRGREREKEKIEFLPLLPFSGRHFWYQSAGWVPVRTEVNLCIRLNFLLVNLRLAVCLISRCVFSHWHLPCQYRASGNWSLMALHFSCQKEQRMRRRYGSSIRWEEAVVPLIALDWLAFCRAGERGMARRWVESRSISGAWQYAKLCQWMEHLWKRDFFTVLCYTLINLLKPVRACLQQSLSHTHLLKDTHRHTSFWIWAGFSSWMLVVRGEAMLKKKIAGSTTDSFRVEDVETLTKWGDKQSPPHFRWWMVDLAGGASCHSGS